MTRSSPAESGGGLLVTVVVPVFNTHPELIERAVVSALAQTHPDLELLIVDDGSTVEVAEFLSRVAERDARIRVVHRANGGVSAARNTGVEQARGEFIAYLDADDYLEPGFLSAALDVARTTEAEAVFGGIRILHESGTAEWRTGGPSAREPLLGTRDMIITACVRALSDSPSPQQPTGLLSVTNVVASLHRTDNARRHRFREGVSHAEDRLYNLSMLLETARVAFCSDPWYVYDQTHEQGVTRRVTLSMINALERTVREFAGVVGAIYERRDLTDDARDRIARAAADGLLNYLKLLTGVMAAVGGRSANSLILRALLEEPSVRIAVKHAARNSWRDRIFASAAYRGHVGLLCLLGRVWARSGRLGMSAADAAPQGSGKKP
ncbi:glycosyltransferase family A protein [Arthrobacter sp. MI7-26]|uniref:glycosyltransferase family 2 protein n=1 Tax=Arthrobacter sp. MI7-26 TaxID=2993653 RepID=UPI002248AF10|nr:glycosyltransferase family A protein [Arthrobacter sp. MI7-26]MCX2747049.1 glycosyltransferase family A protein [Arthrobacter sp. MI7-26]